MNYREQCEQAEIIGSYKKANARLTERNRKLRDMHRYFDRLMDGIVIMLIGLGGAAFLYAVMDFIRWMIG